MDLELEVDPAALELMPAEAILTGCGATCFGTCIQTCVSGFTETCNWATEITP